MAADTPSGAEALEQVFALTREDLRLVLTARRPENRLGLALVLLWTRAERHLPGELTTLPAAVIAVVARQLGLAPALAQQYGQRPATRSAHAARVCAHLGVRPFSAGEERRLCGYLQAKVAQTGNLAMLLDAAEDWLLREAVLRPGGGTTLDRLVIRVRGETEEGLFRQIAAPLGDAARAQLDQLCRTDAGTSVLADLATPPRQASAVAIRQECRRLAQRRAAVPDGVLWEAITPNRRRQWAAIVRRLSAQAMRRYPPEKRATLLLAFLEVRAEEVTDDLIEMYDAVLGGIFADSRAEVAAVQLAQAQEQVDVLRDFRAIAEVLLDPAIAAAEVRPEAFRRVPRHRVSAFMDGPAPPDHGDGPAFFAALRQHFRHRREFLPLLLTTVAFASPRGDSELLPALAVLRTLHAERRRVVPADAPVDFVPKQWRKVVVGAAGIDRHAWEFCLAEQVRLALRAGDLTVIGSRRYTPWDAGLYTGEHWRQRRATWYAEQGLPEDGGAFVRQRKDRLHALATKIAGRLPQNTAVQIEQGKLRLTALEQIDLPAEALQARQALTQVLPLVDLPGLLMEVDHWTGFSAALTRLGARQEPGAERLGSVRAALFAVLVAEATNLGLATMARAAGIPEGQLTRVYDWYFREDTLRAAITRLVQYHRTLPLTRRFGSGTTSSSDGIRFGVASSTLSARHLPRYFGLRRGLTVYGHVLDQGPWFWVNVINCLVRDSTYVLDGLVYQDAPRIQVHYADTHGYSDLVFGLFDLLGFRFAPRLRDLPDQVLYRAEPGADYGPLNPVLRQSIRNRLIVQHWEAMNRLAASFKDGLVLPSLVVAKLQALRRQNPVQQAIQELGRIPKTEHILTYADDPDFRRQVLVALNKHENVHALARVLCYGRQGRFADRGYEAQLGRASALSLVVNALLVWNTRYLDHAAATLARRGEPIPAHVWSHLSPVLWEHVHVVGNYRFEEPALAGGLRPLRFPIQAEAGSDTAVPTLRTATPTQGLLPSLGLE